MLKATAYCLSILGLGFLAIAAWLQAPDTPGVRLSIAVGAACSLAGLAFRLYHHCCEGTGVRPTPSNRRGPQSPLSHQR